jgi:uncharacterized membrane protein YgaE (UPF0421/DUF939 family)
MILYLVLTIQAILEFSIIILFALTIVFVVGNITQDVNTYYRNWKIKKRNKQWEKEHEEFMQRQRKLELEWKLYKEEREKYPLFYWRELCSKQRRELTNERSTT